MIDKTAVCEDCRFWDMSCNECDHPKNRVNNPDDKEYRCVRWCGPLFGCISHEYKLTTKHTYGE